MPWRDPDQQEVGGGIFSTSGISSSDSRFMPAAHTPITPDFQTFDLKIRIRSLTSLVLGALDFGYLMLVVFLAHQLADSSMDFSYSVSMVLTL